MSRDLTSGMVTAILAGTVKPAIFYEGEFSTGTFRLWSGAQDLAWNGHTWTGAGNMLGVSMARETEGVEAVKFTVSLNGESGALLSANLSAVRQGLPGTVWLGCFDSNNLLIVDPTILFKGKMDVPDILDDGAHCILSVSYESRLVDLERQRTRRYTDEDQKIDYPNDEGMGYVAGLQDAALAWGAAGQQTLRKTL